LAKPPSTNTCPAQLGTATTSLRPSPLTSPIATAVGSLSSGVASNGANSGEATGLVTDSSFERGPSRIAFDALTLYVYVAPSKTWSV
jgi:hypothetical protein